MRKKTQVFAAVSTAVALSIGAAGVASAAVMGDPGGPLTKVEISGDLNCNVEFLGDSSPEFYGGTACGTFAAAQDVLYGPQNIPAGGSAGPRTAWTQVSQDQGGSGTASDPFSITTVVTGGSLSVTQVDTYIVGQNSYRSNVSVTNTSDGVFDAIVYRAADCYLQDSDDGYGEHNSATGSVTCRAPSGEGHAGRIEEFIPLTSGSNYLYGNFSEVWSAVGSRLPFPDEVRNGSVAIDNGMGLSWTLNLTAGETRSVSILTNFSPLGEVGLTTSLVPAPSTILAGQDSTVTGSVQNPNITTQALSSVTVTLPPQVGYVAGSSTVLGEPTVSVDGRTLTYTGPFEVPADGNSDFTFQVRGLTAGSGTLGLDASTVGGAPVLATSASITVEESSEPVVVELGTPLVTEASCTAQGEVVPPEVVLPEDTDLVTYTLVGDVVAGSSVTVEATPQGDAILPESADGWVIDLERNVATRTIALEDVTCETPVVTAIPADPKITEATCKAGPKVELAQTEGITYSGLPSTLKAGDKFTLTATPAEGFQLGEAAGWTLNEDGTASKQFTLAKAPKCPTGNDLAKTGANPWMVGVGFAGVGLVAAGAILFSRRKNHG